MLKFFISSIIWSYSFRTLFIKTNSSWKIFESIIAWEFKASVIFNLVLANNTIAVCFFVFLSIIDWYFLIVAVIAQILRLLQSWQFHRNTDERSKNWHGNTCSNCRSWNKKSVQYSLQSHKPFHASYSLSRFALVLQRNNFLFHLYFSIQILQLYFWSNFAFSIKPKIFNISANSSSSNVFSSSFLHLLQIIKRTDIFSEMYDILELLNFLYSPEITQRIFFHFRLLSYWRKLSIILSFFPYPLWWNEFA